MHEQNSDRNTAHMSRAPVAGQTRETTPPNQRQPNEQPRGGQTIG
ncbi:hypothetical protein AVEN_192262-1, partial [Araneus ventricosus]